MRKTNIIATFGFWVMLLAIVFGIATNGGLATIMNFLHLPSFIVTFGGAFAAAMATADSMEDYFDGLKSILDAYKKIEVRTDQISAKILELSDVSRKEGLLSLEEACEQIDNEFLEKGIRLIVDGTDPDLVRDILENELTALSRR